LAWPSPFAARARQVGSAAPLGAEVGDNALTGVLLPFLLCCENVRKRRKKEENRAPAGSEMLFDIVDRASLSGNALRQRDGLRDAGPVHTAAARSINYGRETAPKPNDSTESRRIP
jgi:hypothetical protein